MGPTPPLASVPDPTYDSLRLWAPKAVAHDEREALYRSMLIECIDNYNDSLRE